MIQTTFQRYEKKYLLTPAQYQWIFQQLQSRMQVNEYGMYPICSIYFDTDDYRLIRASLEKPVYKEKVAGCAAMALPLAWKTLYSWN